MPSTSTPPPTAMHGTPAAAARFATPSAVLPKPVWASIRPSPVMTRSARARRAGKSVASITRSIPGRRANDRNRPCAASSANPTPPAAPAPGVSRSRRPSRASSSSAQAAFRASSATGRRQARRPSAVRTSRPRRSARAAGWRHRRRPRRRSRRAGARHRARPSSRPRPPSVVALPPIPSVTCRAPASIAAPTSSPVPTDVAAIGSRSAAATRDRPGRLGHLDDRPASHPPTAASAHRSGAAAGRGPCAVRDVQPPAASIAASVPSPPSASGHSTTSSSGRARRQPSASARATWTEVSEPLNESGAMRIVRRPRARSPQVLVVVGRGLRLAGGVQARSPGSSRP